MNRAVAAMLAAIPLVLFAGVRQASAQSSAGPYDFAGGRWYSDEERDFRRLGYDVGDSYRARQSRPYAGEESEYAGPRNTAQVRVIVPAANAKLWFEGSPTRQDGLVRLFESPALKPGHEYSYDIKAQWKENGKEVSRTIHVDVRANALVTVNFDRPRR
jgi:uncharacterized protein (TIGR03000 family)